MSDFQDKYDDAKELFHKMSDDDLIEAGQELITELEHSDFIASVCDQHADGHEMTEDQRQAFINACAYIEAKYR